MKVAVVTSSFPLRKDDPSAAAGLFVRDFAVALASLDVDVHVLTQDKGWGCEACPPGIKVHCYSWPGNDRPLSQLNLLKPRDLWAAKQLFARGNSKLSELHREIHFDHTLAMWAVPAGSMARRLNRKSNVPYSVWCLGSDIWTYGKLPLLRNIVKANLKAAEKCFADGLQLASDAADLARKQVEFLPSSRKHSYDSISPAKLEGDRPRLLFVGRYAHVKGIDLLLQAIAQLKEQNIECSLTMLGGGPIEANLRQLIQQFDIQSIVTMGGYADSRTYISHLLACDAMVIPSRMESIPVVLSDAVQLGKPVIVSDVGDMGTLVRDSNAGLVFEPESFGSLANALREFAQRSSGDFADGIKSLANQFDIDRTASHFLESIKETERQGKQR